MSKPIRIFGGAWPTWAALTWWLGSGALLVSSWPLTSWAWALVVAMGVEAGLIVRRWRAWAKTAHRPHVDQDWRRAVENTYSMTDWARHARNGWNWSWLDTLLWKVMARLSGKMIWRGARPYMARAYLTPWWWPRAVYLHRIMESDDGTHNHPYGWSCSLILTGSYWEVRAQNHYYDRGSTQEFSHVRKLGRRRRWFNWIPAKAFHAITLDRGPVWTLFVCGPRDRPWGFLDSQGEFHPVGEAQRPDIVTGYGKPGENLFCPACQKKPCIGGCP